MLRITGGESLNFTVKLRDEDGDPFDLTEFSKIEFRFPNNNGTTAVTNTAQGATSFCGIDGLAVLGKINVQLDRAETSVFKVGERQDFTLILESESGDERRIKTFENELSVESAPV